MIIAGLSNLALLPLLGWARTIGALQGVFYSAALLGWLNERQGRRNRLLYLPYYFCRVNFAAVQGFRRFVGRQNNALWTKARRG
jgi:poly-beta-1,6-N-acetyl-D-glucosamine synthase